MNERQIDPSEVRVGDRVRVSYEGTATSVDNGWMGPALQSTTTRVYTLLDRPPPPIPTDDGTVIQHRQRPDSIVRRGGGVWLRRHPSWTPIPAEWRVLVPAEESTPTPAPERKIVALIDRDGDRWKRLGEDEWSVTSTYRHMGNTYRTRESVQNTYGPVTEVYEDEK